MYLIPLVALSLYIRLRFYFWLMESRFPLAQSPDTQWYLDYAHALLRDFKISLHMNDILYMGYNLLLTLLLAILKETDYILFVQALVASICVILVYKITRMLFNRTTAFIASMFYSLSYSITLWSMYILSDSFFVSLLLLNVFLLLKAWESPKKRYKVLFGLTSLYMLIFRPSGIITFAFIAIYIFIRMDKKKLKQWIVRYRIALGSTLAACIAAGLFLLLSGKLTPFFDSLQMNAKMVLYNVYAKGWIYDHPFKHDVPFKPDYRINILNSLILSFIINNWDHILVLYGKRVLAFIGQWIWATNVTILPGFIKFCWKMVPTGLVLLGTIAAFWTKKFVKASIVWLIILAVFLFCIIFFIDGLYRYKAPAMPFLAIAAAYGAERVIFVVIYSAKKLTGKLLWKKERS